MKKRLIGKICAAIITCFISVIVFSALSLPVHAQVGGTSSSEFCKALRNVPGGVLKCSSEVEGLSFTNFKGEFKPPSTEGYDPNLTRAKTLREFVLNIVRFVLGFLGLAAVVVVIWGGVLYVTSAGNEEQANKGKSAIQYAVIGILIILASFALVNTLLQAATGTDQGASNINTVANGDIDGVTEEKRTVFQDAVKELESITQDIVITYENYLDIQKDLRALEFIELQTDEINGLTTIDTVRRQIGDIHLKTKPLSILNDKIGRYLAETLPIYESFALQGKLTQKLSDGTDFISDFQNRTVTLLNNHDQDLGKFFVEKAKQFKALQERVAPSDSDAGITKKISQSLEALQKCAETTALSGRTDTKETCSFSNRAIVTMLQDIATVAGLLNSTEFVEVNITASTITGNAPLIVNFNALGTKDPSNQQTPEQNYVWDLAGSSSSSASCKAWKNTNSTTRANEVPCKGITGPAVSARYTQPGRYVVSLSVESTDKETIAAGRAFIDILVEPPSAKIVLKASPKVGGRPAEDISNNSVYQITQTEAEGGIVLSAKDSQGKAGNEITEYSWNLGNGSPVIKGGASEAEQEVKYLEQGEYQIILEVTDATGIKDRKIFTIVVSSPAARINLNRKEGFVGNEFIIDGTTSSTDTGKISSYQWALRQLAGPCQTEPVPVDLRDDANKERFSFVPEKPGTYEVALIVTDSAGNTNRVATKEVFYVKSQKPIPALKTSNPNQYQPNNFIFDASDSNDPDQNDTKYYRFYVNDDEVTPKDTASNNVVDGKQNDKQCLVENFGSRRAKMEYLFKEKGNYTIKVEVTDEHAESASIEQEITVDSILDIDIKSADGKNFSRNLDASGNAELSFEAVNQSGAAVNYEWDFGDQFSTATDETTNQKTAKHSYTRAGVYTITLTIRDDDDNANTIKKRVYIGNGKGPIAFLTIKKNGVPIPGLKDDDEIVISRNDTLTFDATESKTQDGQDGIGKLRYIWNMGRSDQDLLKGPVLEGFQYEEISPQDKPFLVSLIVETLTPGSNQPDAVNDDLAKRTIKIKVIPLPPKLSGIEMQPQKATLETPLEVKLKVLGAKDPDGKITSYRWWYYEKAGQELDPQISTNPETTMVINTIGKQGEKHTYKFGVEITDNDNFKVRSDEILLPERIPAIQVTNGANDPPVAEFSVNKTNIIVGESVNFVSSSKDPDGRIEKYIWDVEGNGFHDNQETDQSNIAYTYTEKNPEGIAVRLKVIDNNKATAVSDPIRIYVDSISVPPEAAFTYEITGDKEVTFKNNSTVDERTGQSIEQVDWDFNLIEDADGNGTPDDDSEVANKDNDTGKKGLYVQTYPDYGIYRVKLTVTDTEGNQDSVTRFVKVEKQEETLPGTDPNVLDARLITNPLPQVNDGKVHLTGSTGNVTFEYKTSKGPIARYVIDKNILFDTNGNGVKDDDEDHIATPEEVVRNTKGSWTTNFEQTWGQTVVRLTIYDKEGNKDSVDKEVIFDNPQTLNSNNNRVGATSVLQASSIQTIVRNSHNYAELALTTGFAILLAGALLAFKDNKSLKKENTNK